MHSSFLFNSPRGGRDTSVLYGISSEYRGAFIASVFPYSRIEPNWIGASSNAEKEEDAAPRGLGEFRSENLAASPKITAAFMCTRACFYSLTTKIVDRARVEDFSRASISARFPSPTGCVSGISRALLPVTAGGETSRNKN